MNLWGVYVKVVEFCLSFLFSLGMLKILYYMLILILSDLNWRMYFKVLFEILINLLGYIVVESD